jgi:secreted PhoX family phosphatase
MAGFSGDGDLATKASLNNPTSLVFDKQGNLLISDTFNNRVRKVDSKGIITTIIGNDMAGFSGDGGQANKATLNAPGALALDNNGNLLIADTKNNRVRRVDNQGVITTIVGNGQTTSIGDNGLATNAGLNGVCAVIADANNNLFIADTGNNRIRRVDSKTSIITTVVGNGTALYQGDGTLATNASLNSPRGLAIDTAGNLLIADTGNTSVRIVKGIAKVQTQPSILISSVSLQKKILTIKGTGFLTSGSKVSINAKDVSKLIKSQSATEIDLKGNKKKLNLQKGSNSITVIINGISSNTFTLNL